MNSHRTGYRFVFMPLMAALILGGAGLFSSCSTTRGAAYSSSVGQDAAAAAAARKKAEEQKRKRQAANGQNGPTVPSTGAQHAEQRPPLASGPGHVPPSYPGYGPWHDLTGRIVDLFIEVARVATSGSIVIEDLPPGARLSIDGQAVADSRFLLPAGSHYLRAEAFGMMPWAATIGVLMGQTQTVKVKMTPAPFSLGAVSANPGIYDPSAPGRLGRLSLSFMTSGPGKAELAILDASGRTIYEREDLPVLGARTETSWDGRDSRGRELRLEAGEYRVRVRAESSSGSRAEAWARFSIVEEHATATYSSLAGGFSGGMYAPDARVLASGRVETSLGSYAVLDPSGKAAARAPAYAGLRVGLPGNKSEFCLSTMGVFYPGYALETSADWGSIAASFKFNFAADETWALSLLLGGNYGSYFAAEAAPSWDGPARFPGGDIGLAVESDSGIARAFASIQAHASSYYPGWGDTSAVPGFYTWLYLRGGLEFILPDFLGSEASLAISAAGRTSPFVSGFSFGLPLSMAAELHYYLPDSPAVLSFHGSGEWAARNSWYLGAGLGLGFMF